MPGKCYSPEEIILMLREDEVLLAEVIRRLGVTKIINGAKSMAA